jgi:hypothetical protein
MPQKNRWHSIPCGILRATGIVKVKHLTASAWNKNGFKVEALSRREPAA